MHVAAMESLIAFLKPGSKVLDIGSGSGYLTAAFAELVFPAGSDAGSGGKGDPGLVVGIEHVAELVEIGRRNLGKSARGQQMQDSGQVRLVVGDGRVGMKQEGGWDAIHVGAAASVLHEQLVEQLKASGR